METSTQTFIAVSAADSLVGEKMPAYIPLHWELKDMGYSNSYAVMLDREQFEVWNEAIMAEFGHKAGYHFDGDILVANSNRVPLDSEWIDEERKLMAAWGIPNASTIEPVTIVMESDQSTRLVYFVHGSFVVYIE